MRNTFSSIFRRSIMNFHPGAQHFTKTGASGFYDSARPTYPHESVKKIYDYVGLNKPINIAELGSGTGIFTRILLKDFADRTQKITAIEPSEGMRQGFEKATLENAPPQKVELVEGTFHQTPVEDGWADLVVIAQAYHWNDTHYVEALTEFNRILKPGGVVALIWNWQDTDTKWVEQTTEIEACRDTHVPQYRHQTWRNTFKVPYFAQHFEKEEEFWFHHSVTVDRQNPINRVLSKSFISGLDQETQDKIAVEVGEIIDRGEGITWVDKEKGLFEYPYKVDLVVFRKK